MRAIIAIACLLTGGLAGAWIARSLPADPPGGTAEPAEWVARVGDRYVTADMVRAEMLRRGGLQPGQFQTPEQKRALLDEMLLHHALVESARKAGIDAQPEIRRSIEQLLTSQYLRDTLRATQSGLSVTDAEVEAYYAAHTDDFTVPARRRIAMLRVGVAEGADEAAWDAARKRLQEARGKVATLGADILHFGPIAREYSDDQATRYRGGVLGWVRDGRAQDYRHDRAMLEAADALKEPGALSDIVRGADGLYLVRLVEATPEQPRSLDELRDGLRQRLLQQRYAEAEQAFRRTVMAEHSIDIDSDRLAAIQPPGPPASGEPQQPPALPADQETRP